MRRILITGSRDWTDRKVIAEWLEYELERSDNGMIVVEGGARGADRLAGEWAKANGHRGVVHEQHPADWARFGGSAGPVRNTAMVQLGAEVCLAFPLPGSVGTLDCMRKAQAARIPVTDCS